MRRVPVKARPPCLPAFEARLAMNRQDFLGPKTIAVAAGVPPMGTVFSTVLAADCRPTIDPQQGLLWGPAVLPPHL
jgi:hypothetical protein